MPGPFYFVSPMADPTNIYYTITAATDYTFPFPYLSAANVKVAIDGDAAPYTLIAQNTVRITAAGNIGKTLRVYRETPKTPIHTWEDGAVILGAHMNAAHLQSIYIAEEAYGYAEGLAEEAKQYALDGVQSAVVAGVETAADLLRSEISGDLAAAQVAADSAATSATAATTARDDVSQLAEDTEALLDTVAADINDAQTTLDTFRRLVLGAFDTPPTTDPMGDPIAEGAFYYNTSTEQLYVWDGVMWQRAYFSVDVPEEILASLVLNNSLVAGASVKDALNALHTGKAAETHSHVPADISGLAGLFADKADAEHGHDLEDVAGLGDALALKADTGAVTALSATVALKADTSAVTAALADKADTSAMEAALDAKADASVTIGASGLATGGGTLTANRTIAVAVASKAQAEAGTVNTVSMTPLRVAEAIAALAPSGLGDGQTVSAPSRTHTTVYQNTTGKPIFVFIHATATGSGCYVNVGSGTTPNIRVATMASTSNVTAAAFVVPPSWRYALMPAAAGNSVTITNWSELR